MPTLLSGRAPAGLWEGLAAQVEALGFTLHQIPDAASIGGANGPTDFSTRKVSVRADMDDSARVKQLAHELGHVIVSSPDIGSTSLRERWCRYGLLMVCRVS